MLEVLCASDAEREKAAIGEFITGVVSASHGLALIGRSNEVRGRRVQSMTCYHAEALA
jgi:hypothetical protein